MPACPITSDTHAALIDLCPAGALAADRRLARAGKRCFTRQANTSSGQTTRNSAAHHVEQDKCTNRLGTSRRQLACLAAVAGILRTWCASVCASGKPLPLQTDQGACKCRGMPLQTCDIIPHVALLQLAHGSLTTFSHACFLYTTLAISQQPSWTMAP
jgi:hypothetical protein